MTAQPHEPGHKPTPEEIRRRADLGEPTGGSHWDDAFEARLRSRAPQGR